MKTRPVMIILVVILCVSMVTVTLPEAFGPIKSAYAPVMTSSSATGSATGSTPPNKPNSGIIIPIDTPTIDVEVKLFVKPMPIRLARSRPITIFSFVVKDQSLDSATEWLRGQTIMDEVPMDLLLDCLPDDGSRGETVQIMMMNELEVDDIGTTVTYGGELTVKYLSPRWILIWGTPTR